MAEPVLFTPVPGKALTDFLFERGLEFPCGGSSRCGACRFRVLSGEVPITDDMQAVLSADDLRAGWRLGCGAMANGPVELDIAEWTSEILQDHATLAFEAGIGYAIAVDVGSTTLAAQLLDLATGEVIRTETALNPQARFGADIMTRVGYDLEHPGELTSVIRQAVGSLVTVLAQTYAITEILLVGNSVMHHLFCGLDLNPLATVPFETPRLDACTFTGREMDWQNFTATPVTFLDNLGSFVGSDILAGIVAEALDRSDRALIDLGTNGEIVVSHAGRLWCASTAAGPAFEAGRIRYGMRASSGAIHRVRPSAGGSLEISVLGGIEPRGICGSGLVDAVAAALATGALKANGRFQNGKSEWQLIGEVVLTQKDIRELQLAKAAVASGLTLLERQSGEVIEHLSLAGAFGNYVNLASAVSIGLLPAGISVRPAGNTALRGVKMLLLTPSTRTATIRRIREATTHVPLAALPEFQDCFSDALSFPAII